MNSAQLFLACAVILGTFSLGGFTGVTVERDNHDELRNAIAACLLVIMFLIAIVAVIALGCLIADNLP